MKEIKLKKIDIFSIVLGAIIGWGSFMLPGTKFLKESGVINTFLGLLFGVVCIIIIEKNYLVMMQNHDEEGGEFSYTYNNLGKKHGFIVGWFLTLAYFTMIPLNATAFPLVIQKIFGDVLEFGYLYSIAGYNIYLGEILMSSLVIIAFAYLNLKGIKKTSKVQNLIIFSLITMVMLVLLGMIIKGNKLQFLDVYIKDYSFSISEIAKVFAITPFAFIGFDAIPQLSNELGFSKKKASRVALISLVMGALIYNVLNIITALAYSPEQALTLDWAAGSAVLSTLGKGAFLLLIIALTAAVWSGINGFMICSSKLLGSIANYKMLPLKIGKINKNGVFGNAIIFISIISLIAPWFGRQAIIWIVDMSSLGASVAYFYVSLIGLKKACTNKSKLLAIVGTIISVIFMILLILPTSPAALAKESLIALAIWCVIGIVAYLKIRLKKEEVRENFVKCAR